MTAFLLEKSIPKQIIGPVNLNTGANTGNRVDMKGLERVTFLVSLGAGATTTAHSFSLKQSNAATSGSTKALAVKNPYYHLVGAATKFTRVVFQDADSALDTYDLHSLLGDSASVVALEVLAEDLDITNGFEWASLNIAVTGQTQLGSVLAIGHEVKSKPAYLNIV